MQTVQFDMELQRGGRAVRFTAAASGHGGQRAGRHTHDPGKTADLRGVEDAAPYIPLR